MLKLKYAVFCGLFLFIGLILFSCGDEREQNSEASSVSEQSSEEGSVSHSQATSDHTDTVESDEPHEFITFKVTVSCHACLSGMLVYQLINNESMLFLGETSFDTATASFEVEVSLGNMILQVFNNTNQNLHAEVSVTIGETNIEVSVIVGGAPDADSDGDGVPDGADNCPDDVNKQQTDDDGDGVGNPCDVCPNDPEDDEDSDKICSPEDVCPSDPNKTTSGQCGCGVADTDSDSDSIANCHDNCSLISNQEQTDSDQDGRGDVCDTCPLDDKNDVDGDGVCGDADNCPANHNPDQLDCNWNGVGDTCEIQENGFIGLASVCGDMDEDGVSNEEDNCPVVPNGNQLDTDQDMIGDLCDNCPLNANNHQADDDGDTVGDACDDCPTVVGTPDHDGCTLLCTQNSACSSREFCRFSLGVCQGNGTCTIVSEECPTLNAPVCGCNGVTYENECESYKAETSIKSVGACGTALVDTDSDGVPDGEDNCPNTANTGQANTDGDEMGDLCDPDMDNDSVENTLDNCPNGVNPDQLNADGDSFGNICDQCPQDKDNDIDEDGICGDVDNCPICPNLDQADCDQDKQGNECDIESSGLQCPDADSDGISDDADNCVNGVNNDQGDVDDDGVGDVCDNCKVVPNAGQLDSDGDRVGNACDGTADIDGDGKLDGGDNCPTVRNGDCSQDPLNCDSNQDGLVTNAENGTGFQENGDTDALGDACDNCWHVPNADQLDDDSDSLGNVCDLDIVVQIACASGDPQCEILMLYANEDGEEPISRRGIGTVTSVSGDEELICRYFGVVLNAQVGQGNILGFEPGIWYSNAGLLDDILVIVTLDKADNSGREQVTIQGQCQTETDSQGNKNLLCSVPVIGCLERG